jgi:hypothetical protein
MYSCSMYNYTNRPIKDAYFVSRTSMSALKAISGRGLTYKLLAFSADMKNFSRLDIC